MSRTDIFNTQPAVYEAPAHSEPGSHPDEKDIARYSLNRLYKQITQVQFLMVVSSTLLWQQTKAD